MRINITFLNLKRSHNIPREIILVGYAHHSPYITNTIIRKPVGYENAFSMYCISLETTVIQKRFYF